MMNSDVTRDAANRAMAYWPLTMLSSAVALATLMNILRCPLTGPPP